MSHARRAFVLTAASFVLAFAACGDFAADSSFGDSDGRDGKADGGASTGGFDPTQHQRGVILVHAAAFPSFRLCFQNMPDARPQPDSRIMPEANVVGVEVGSLVRLDPMTAPGQVYVIPEENVRAAPGEQSLPCKQLIPEMGAPAAKALDRDLQYQVATSIDTALGQDRVSVLAITGCGGNPFLNLIGAGETNCGGTWDKSAGNLTARTFDLTVYKKTSSSDLTVQLFQMSTQLADVESDGGSPLEVTFGGFDDDAGALDQGVPLAPLYEGGERTDLTFDQGNPAVYATTGFRISSDAFSIDQSLATVQELSSSRDLPTEYYRAASSYALLLLGDPAHTPTAADGGPNAAYNPRRAVHLLAVPVVDPTAVDAGTSDGGDAGSVENDAGSSDGG